MVHIDVMNCHSFTKDEANNGLSIVASHVLYQAYPFVGSLAGYCGWPVLPARSNPSSSGGAKPFSLQTSQFFNSALHDDYSEFVNRAIWDDPAE